MKTSSLYMLAACFLLSTVILAGLFVPFINALVCAAGTISGAALLICAIRSTLQGN